MIKNLIAAVIAVVIVATGALVIKQRSGPAVRPADPKETRIDGDIEAELNDIEKQLDELDLTDFDADFSDQDLGL